MSDPAAATKPGFKERWMTAPPDASASGGASATPAGQWAWAGYEGARNPHVLLITIYIFAPYFARNLMSDPVAGQALWADLNTLAGVIIACIAPMLGAIADAGGRRKPWLFVFSVILGATASALWTATWSASWRLWAPASRPPARRRPPA
jgi:UMF1 family MFS transporter